MIRLHYFTFNPFQENTYILSAEDGSAIVIDPGCYTEEEEQELITYLEKEHLKPVRLLNTHCHLDHVFGNAFVAKFYGLEVEIHPGEQIVLDQALSMSHLYGIPMTPSPVPKHSLLPGISIPLGDDQLEILFTPGHSPASISLYCKNQGFLIAGDVLFQESIGRTDLPGGNMATLLKSIREAFFVLPDDTLVYPGHGPHTTIGHERRHNPFLT
ncbi:MAG TPA: MBL fold metallo-hydrolase [Saprospiraceae bacterium]|nr:MBL fold metallo-hydrolase [Saprospiraceae bacterium]MCB9269974.1 MBL fold metallo-hydrolase [Lewinellaceae bacterium]HPG09256.1 MBL fold metallo-hydrolase [Saprospiraceae bacterium]HQU53249.1 MBL fold metallo-hydrolase [Saprospiraceae bacterium]HRV86745.1 MBL fold metallo-hydrolase [Saprospiraceae bacterium]